MFGRLDRTCVLLAAARIARPAHAVSRASRRVPWGFEPEGDGESLHWWHRIAARGTWVLQGWRKHKVYPDFLICLKSDKKGRRLLVLETKGQQLKGAADTEFKQRLFEVLEAAFEKAHDVGAVELVGEGIEEMRFRMLMEDRWEPDLQASLQ